MHDWFLCEQVACGTGSCLLLVVGSLLSFSWQQNERQSEEGQQKSDCECDYNHLPWQSHTLQWRHNGCDDVSDHQPHECLPNRLFRRRSKKTSKLRVTGLFVGNSPVTGEFPAQRASNAENVSIWWRHHDSSILIRLCNHSRITNAWHPWRVHDLRNHFRDRM